jgi:ribosomal protein S18 acetylase RimI-like enzyme
MPRGRSDRRSGFAPRVTVDVRVAERRGARAAGDRDFVTALGHGTAASSVGSLRPADEANLREAFDRLYAIVESQSHLTLIAERNGERVGFLFLLDNLPDEVTLLTGAFVAYMAVQEGSRRAGAGAALLAAAENEARRRGLPYMALMVSEANEPARLLYDRNGYQTERRMLCKHL